MPPRRASRPRSVPEGRAAREPADDARPARSGRSGRLAEVAKRLQPRVDVVVGMVVRAFVERQATDDAKARAIRSVERRDRLRELDRLANGSLEVELVMVRQPDDALLLLGRVRWERCAGLEVDRGPGLLLELGPDRDVDVAQAARALHRQDGRDVGVDDEASIRAGDVDATFDRTGEAELLAEIDADVVEDVVADCPG